MEWQRAGRPDTETKVGYRTIVTKHFVLPDGQTAEFQVLNKQDTHCAGVIALTSDRQVIIARQFRPGPEKVMDEIPGGAAEQGETDYQAVAVRELREETGYKPGRVTSLGTVYKDSYNNAAWHYFFAEDCELTEDGPANDAFEFIEVELISIKQLFKNARSGNMTDTEAVFLAYEKLKEIEEGI